MTIAFLVTAFIVVVTPGTGVLYTLAAALSRGYRASVVAAFGCTLGIVPHMVAAMLGLAAVLNASAIAFQRSSISASLTCSTSPGARCASTELSMSIANSVAGRRCR